MQTSLLGFPHPQPCRAGLEDGEGHGDNGQRADRRGEAQPRDPRSSYCGTRLGPSRVPHPNCGTGTAPRGRGSPVLREGAGTGSASRGLRSAPPLPVLPRPAAPRAAPRCGGAAGGPVEPRGRRSPGPAPVGLEGRKEEGRDRTGTHRAATGAGTGTGGAARPGRRRRRCAPGPARAAALYRGGAGAARSPRGLRPAPGPAPPAPAPPAPPPAPPAAPGTRPAPAPTPAPHCGMHRAPDPSPSVSRRQRWETRGHRAVSLVPPSRTLPTSPRPPVAISHPLPETHGDTSCCHPVPVPPPSARTEAPRPSQAMSPCQADGRALPAPGRAPPSRSLSSLGSDPALSGSPQAGRRARCRPPGDTPWADRGGPPRTAGQGRAETPALLSGSHVAPNGHIVSPLLGRAARDVPALQAAGKGRGQEGAHPHPAAGAQRWGYAAAPLPFSVMAAPGRSPRTSASQGINKISSSSGTEISLFAAAELQPDAQGAALIQTSHSNPSSGRLLQALAKRSRYGSIPACARSPTPAPAGSGDSAEERLSANEDNALPATHTPSTARHGAGGFAGGGDAARYPNLAGLWCSSTTHPRL